MTVVLAPEALEDLEVLADTIAEDKPVAAARFVQRVFDVIDRLADAELQGPEQRLRSGQRVRSWPVPPARVYYRRDGEDLVVLRIYHQAQRPL